MTTIRIRETSGTTVSSPATTTLDADDEDTGSSGDIDITTESSTIQNHEQNNILGSSDDDGKNMTATTVGILLGILAFIFLLGALLVIWRKKMKTKRSTQDHAGQQGQFKKKFEESGAYKNNSAYAFPDPSSVASIGSYDGLHLYGNTGPSADVGAAPYEQLSFTTTGADYEALRIAYDDTQPVKRNCDQEAAYMNVGHKDTIT